MCRRRDPGKAALAARYGVSSGSPVADRRRPSATPGQHFSACPEGRALGELDRLSPAEKQVMAVLLGTGQSGTA
jgi:hypothetical protein